MGEVFGQSGLTTPNSAMIDPTSGQPTAMGTPNQMMLKAGQQLKDTSNTNAASDIAGNPITPPASPTLGTPTFQQAATNGALPGSTNAMSPGLNKAGKLLTLLSSGLQGALAGRAADEQATVQSGGRRSGGAGMGFEAGYAMPWQRAGMAEQFQQQQAQTKLLQQQGDMVQTPGGPMPLSLAKVFYPAAIRAGAQESVANTNVQGRENVAQTGAAARTGAAQIGAGARTGAAQIGADARIKAAQLNLGPVAQVPQDLQEQFGLPAELPLRMLNQAETAANKPLTIVQGENGPAIVNKAQSGKGVGATPKSLGVGSPRLGGLTPTADPNNPGNITFMTAGNAIRSGAASPQSAPTKTAQATARSVAPGGKVGEEVNAFNTAIQHADLLRTAVASLNNGDQQTLNSLKNRFGAEFGMSGPITAQAIADAYQREITSMLSKGHMTDSEIGSVGKTLNVNAQSPQQSLGVIDAYRALAQSKMNVRQQGVNQGMKGKANFPTATAAPGVTHVWTPQGLQPAP